VAALFAAIGWPPPSGMAFPFLFLVAIISALVVFDLRVHLVRRRIAILTLIPFSVIRIEFAGFITSLRAFGAG
jgi:hypothetical protein